MIRISERLEMLKFDRDVFLAICNKKEKLIVNKLYDERALAIVGHWHCDCEGHVRGSMCCYCDCGNRFGREYEKEDYYGEGK